VDTRNRRAGKSTAERMTTVFGRMLLAAVVIISITSCATPIERAENAFAEGDYIGAVESALKALEKEPGLTEAEMILSDSWRLGNQRLRSDIERYGSSKAVWEAEKVLPAYDSLIRLHVLVLSAGRRDLDPDPEGVRSERADAVDMLAEMHVFEGSKLIVPGTRDEALAAVDHYLRAQELKPDYPFLEDKIRRAKELSLAKVFVFTGPERDVTLNGTLLVPEIENGLEKLEGVEVVRVVSRYAAPIDNNYNADDFARSHGANLMLHVEPTTVKSVSVKKDTRQLYGVSWQRETLELEASASTDIRYVLINLETDTVVSEGTFTVNAHDNGGFSAEAILHQGDSRQVDLGEGTGMQLLLINRAPVAMDDVDLRYRLSLYDGLNVNEYAETASLNLSPATYSTGERIVLEGYTHPSQLAGIEGLQGHTFWLFDAIAFDIFNDGSLSYQFVYRQQMDSGLKGHLSTAAYGRDLYGRIESWMNQRKVREELMDQFFPTYYNQTVPAEIVKKAAPLLQR
jgi:hypothetical protein